MAVTPERVAIVGSRDYRRLDQVRAFVQNLPAGTIVVSGGARGVDQAAEQEAIGCGLLVEVVSADWNAHGRAAGPIRNTEIVRRADRVVAFWDGSSRGTQDTIRKARAAGKPVEIRTPGAAP